MKTWRQYMMEYMQAHQQQIFDLLIDIQQGQPRQHELDVILANCDMEAVHDFNHKRNGVFLFDEEGNRKLIGVYETDQEAFEALKSAVDAIYGECDEEPFFQYMHPRSPRAPQWMNDGIVDWVYTDEIDAKA